jgi:hypothetical protein
MVITRFKRNFIVYLVCFVSAIQTTKASHAVGAELTYRCLGNNQYELNYVFYRDCSGIAANPQIDIVVTNTCGLTNPLVTLTATSSSPTEITLVCPIGNSTCHGGSEIGIQKWVYSGIITLPGTCTEWKFSHSEASRNIAITTIPNANLMDLYVYAMLNNSNSICNNSTVFISDPIFAMCINRIACYNLAPFDADGDSLAFIQITPLIGPGPADTVIFGQGYSTAQPIHSNPPVIFYPGSGMLCMTPIQLDVSTAAILVSEYRNGVLIGQVERDIQLNVIPCINNNPTMTGINGFPNFDMNICPGEETCFKIYSADADTSNLTRFTIDSLPAGATFQTSGGQRDTATVCWTPSITDIGNPHCFNISVSDDACPYFGIEINNFCITVRDSSVCITSVKENELGSNILLNIYPQPAKNSFYLDFGKDFLPDQYYLFIRNSLGQLVYQNILREKITSLNAEQFLSGEVFFAYIMDKDKNLVRKNKILLVR